MLKFAVFGGTRERDDVADVGHARNEQQQALESQAESAVRAAAEAAGVDVPLEVAAAHLQLVDAALQFLQVGFAFGSADDLADLREKDMATETEDSLQPKVSAITLETSSAHLLLTSSLLPG